MDFRFSILRIREVALLWKRSENLLHFSPIWRCNFLHFYLQLLVLLLCKKHATWLSDAGIFVSTINPLLIRAFGDDSLRAPKTDKADAKKIARYTLDRWAKLKQYGHMDETRNTLKTMNRQFGFYMDQKTAMKNNLIALQDQTFPGANTFFDSPARKDGSQKWVDFAHTYWHVDCVREKSLEAFTEHYQKWCKRKGYNFSADKAEKIYHKASDLIAVFPKDAYTKQLVRQAVAMLNLASETVETLRAKMDQLASTLPEYPVVMAMNGVGPTLGLALNSWLRSETSHALKSGGH